jgi:transcriptional regulator with XRE-family HTH domain
MIREPEFAKRVAAQREARNLSSSECARLMGVSRQHFNNWEAGICKPKGEKMAKLATLLQCDSVWLRHGESSEVEQRIENVMLLMRSVVRDLDHIHKALALARGEQRGAEVSRPGVEQCGLVQEADN